MEVKETKLFRVSTTLSIYPQFFVVAYDILDATAKAKEITDYFKNNKVVGAVSVIDIPVLSLEKTEETK